MSSEEMSCSRLLESISEYIDGELSDELSQKIERHMDECDHCRVVVDTVNRTIYLYHCDAQEIDVPADVRKRLFEALHLEEYSGSRDA